MLHPDSIYPAPHGKRRLFAHVILTRFNMRFQGERRDLVDEDEARDWFAHRLPLFRDFCLPSIVGQTRSPALWLLGLDGSRRHLAEPLLELIAPWPWIKPAWQGETDGVPELNIRCFARTLRENLPRRAHYIVTTRLDNDDALSCDYWRQAERYAGAVVSRQPDLQDFWITFPLGAQFADGSFRLLSTSRGHFHSRVTAVGALTEADDATAYGANHRALFEQDLPVFLPPTGRPMWLETVHDRNVVNAVRDDAFDLGPAERICALFGLDPNRVLNRPEPAMTPPKTVYKILTAAQLATIEADGSFAGSPDDLRDGFVHMSTADQLAGTLDRHFAGHEDLAICAVDAEACGPALRWEESRGGALFPHLYAPLSLATVLAYGPLARADDGTVVLPVAG